jgi:hypothetical protein
MGFPDLENQALPTLFSESKVVDRERVGSARGEKEDEKPPVLIG